MFFFEFRFPFNMKKAAVALGLLSVAVGGVAAWGKQGHMAVG